MIKNGHLAAVFHHLEKKPGHNICRVASLVLLALLFPIELLLHLLQLNYFMCEHM